MRDYSIGLVMIYVYTCILNGFDNLRPPAVPAEDGGVRFICFTNIPNLPRVFPWEYRPAYITGNAARDSRIPKILPHLMLPRDAQYSIWHDGNYVLKVGPCAIIDALLDNADWAAHRHPQRECIYAEADLILNSEWATDQLKVELRQEIARYRALPYPEQNGLWANGLLVRRHTAGVRDLNEQWWKLYAAGGARDQVSFPVAVHLRDFDRLRTLPENIFASPYMQFRWHAAWKTREDNPDFWEQRALTRTVLEELRDLTGHTSGIAYHEY